MGVGMFKSYAKPNTAGSGYIGHGCDYSLTQWFKGRVCNFGETISKLALKA